MAFGTFNASFAGKYVLKTQTVAKWKRNMSITNDFLKAITLVQDLMFSM